MLQQTEPPKAEPPKKLTMSVPEMRHMLGLGKTESYWLVHKNYFRTFELNGSFRVDIASFEEWYAGQVKYRKADGPPPGEKLREKSYSARDIAELLDVSEATAYDIIKDHHLPTVIVDCWKRVPREAFEKWYRGQEHYRLKEDREREEKILQNSLSQAQIAWLLGVDREKIYLIMGRKHAADIFDIVTVAGQKRITIESFLRWYDIQTQFTLQYNTIADSNGELAAANYQSQRESMRMAQRIKEVRNRIRENSRKADEEIPAEPIYMEETDLDTAIARYVQNRKLEKEREQALHNRADEAAQSGAKVKKSHHRKDENSSLFSGMEGRPAVKSGPRLSVQEAAKLLGVKDRTINDWIRTGRIDSVKRQNRNYVLMSDVEALAEGGKKLGRDKTKIRKEEN